MIRTVITLAIIRAVIVALLVQMQAALHFTLCGVLKELPRQTGLELCERTPRVGYTKFQPV